MRSRAKLPCSKTQLEIAIILFCCLCAFPILAAAQGAPGLNAVCSSTSVCSSSSDTVGTSAFIDASMFVGSVPSPTFCSVLNDVLAHVIQPTYPNGAVIDARGLPGTNASMACSTSPWGSGSGYLNVPSVVLLPAGTITISVPWVLPGNTKLIGIAASGNNSLLDTTIQASFSSGAVLQFGDSHCPSSGCQGISVEHLSISGDFDEII
jgi:hypothetical protein